MLKILAPAALVALLLTMPGWAQVPNPAPTTELPHDRGYDKHTPKHDAVDAQEAPVTRDLNNAVEQQTELRALGAEIDQAQYEKDLAAYSDDVTRNARQAMYDKVRYDRQRRAYADAMAAWRAQVAACDKGKTKACEAPAPRIADFY